MTTVMSQKGQIELPSAVREQLALSPGDDFEVTVDENDRILLKRVTHEPNAGLIDHLLSAPGYLDIPERSDDIPVAVAPNLER